MSTKKQKSTTILTSQEQYQSCPRANLLRRLGAYIYNLLAVIALLMLATVIALVVVVIAEALSIIDTSAYPDVAGYLSNSLIFASYLAAVIIIFFAYFWSTARPNAWYESLAFTSAK
ncbi:hypothetical protein [Psychromonas sp. MME2]|uniref:hypothetical protein n=1 Tax=Psychromonas sp. MME2 TaxID=3231033 RepID=UPI00339C0425